MLMSATSLLATTLGEDGRQKRAWKVSVLSASLPVTQLLAWHCAPGILQVVSKRDDTGRRRNFVSFLGFVHGSDGR